LKKPFLSDVSIIFSGQLIAGGAAFIYTVITARLLGIEDYGLFQSLFALYGICSLFSNPLYLSVVHGVGVSPPEFRAEATGQFIKVASIFAGMIAVGLIIISPKLIGVLHMNSLLPIWIVAILLITRAWLTTIYGSIQGQNQHGLFSVSKIAEALICLIIGTMFLVLGGRTVGAIFGYFWGMVLPIFYFVFIKRIFIIRKGFDRIKVEFGNIAKILIAFGVLTMIDNLPILIGRSKLSPEESGLFGALFNLRNILFPFAFAVAVPFYTHSLNGNQQPSIFKKALLLVSGLGVGFVCAGILFPKFLISTIYGRTFVEASQYMAIYGVSLWLEMILIVLIFYRLAQKKINSWILPLPIFIFIPCLFFSHLNIGQLMISQIVASIIYVLIFSANSLFDRS